MRRVLIGVAGALAALLLFHDAARAQPTNNAIILCKNTTTSVWQPCNGSTDAGLPVTGTFSSSIAAFAPTGQASLSVSNSSSRVALGSAGPTAVVKNTGANVAYILFGSSGATATTSSYPVLAGEEVAFNVGSNTYIAGITASSTTTLLVTTGTGLPALAISSSGGGGTVSISQATPGTTNGTAIVGVNAATALAGAGATGAGSLRTTVAQDSTTLAGSPPGTGASPSTSVLSAVQLPSTNSAVGLTPVVSASAESSHILKGSAGNLYAVYATAGATAGFLMVFNATTAPSDGAVTPVECVPIIAGGTASISYGNGPPAVYSTGITAVFSSTGCFTKTASATAFFHGSVD